VVDVSALLGDAAWTLAQSARACEHSRWLQTETRALLLTYQWHRMPRLSGGSDGSIPDDDGTSKDVRARIRLLINPREKPRIYAGASMLTTSCDLCHKQISLGSEEYEIEFGALTVRLDRACFGFWQEEVTRTKPQQTRQM
jgi:hypothetical protein